MIEAPPYIRRADIATPELPFAWDEWNIKSYYMFADEELFHRLDAITNAANTALVMALGEWICWRFTPVSSDPRPLQFIEAGWAAVVDPIYCEYTETVDDEWRGPARAPLAVTIAIANDAIFYLDHDPHVATRVCWMWNLARHVITDHGPLDTWFEAIVHRLATHHRKEGNTARDEDLFAERTLPDDPVPREATDPDFPYDPSQAPRLIDRFLRGLSPAENPFLKPARLIRAADVPRPYRYLPDADSATT